MRKRLPPASRDATRLFKTAKEDKIVLLNCSKPSTETKIVTTELFRDGRWNQNGTTRLFKAATETCKYCY